MDYTLEEFECGETLILRLQKDDVGDDETYRVGYDATFRDDNIDIFFFCHPYPVTLVFYGCMKQNAPVSFNIE